MTIVERDYICYSDYSVPVIVTDDDNIDTTMLFEYYIIGSEDKFVWR